MNTITTLTKPVLTRKEAACYLSVCLTTLDKLAIPHIKINRTVRYKKVDIDTWLSMQAQQKTEAAECV